MATLEYHLQAVDRLSPLNHEWCTYYLNLRKLNRREIKLRDGSGTKIIIDQNYNRDSAEILIGGIANQSTIVATTLRTTGETKVAKEIFRVLKKLVVKHSTKADSNNFVFPGALTKLKNGWRLAPSIESHESLNIYLP